MKNRHPAVVYWVRHGENLANVSGQFSNRRIDLDLTEKGVLQARQVAEFLAAQAMGNGPVFSSPLLRAVQTAEIIAARLGRPIEVLEELREVDLGDLEGRSDAAAFDLYWDVLGSWRAGDRTRAFPGGENHLQMAARIEAALERVIRAGAGEPGVVAAHAGLLRTGFTHLLDDPFPMKITVPNCSVSRLEMSGPGRVRFAYVARSDFLTQATEGKGA
jgi:broad specificity phosphatase PhoE